MPPRVSVLVPAYNAAPFVDAAIESIKRQTFEDWEVVAVDDASTDGTLDRMRAHESSRIHVHTNDRNLGMTPNWNHALSLSTGELVIKLDADDQFKPDALERLVAALDDAKIVAAGIRTLCCTPAMEPYDGLPADDVMVRAGIDPYADRVLTGDQWYDFAALGHQLWSSCAFMLRRTLFDTIGAWDERFVCSDAELGWRTMETGQPIAHVGSVGVLYRMLPGSSSDISRSQGWRLWDGSAANLLSMSRERKRRPLRRSLRMHYVRLWRMWQHGAEQRRAALPEPLRIRLEEAMRAVTPPPLSDVILTRIRDGVSAA